MEKRKFLTFPGLELRPLGRPARSQSLYRLRNPGTNNIVIVVIAMAQVEPIAMAAEVRNYKTCPNFRRHATPLRRYALSRAEGLQELTKQAKTALREKRKRSMV
jgi:hypothetical protein